MQLFRWAHRRLASLPPTAAEFRLSPAENLEYPTQYWRPLRALTVARQSEPRLQATVERRVCATSSCRSLPLQQGPGLAKLQSPPSICFRQIAPLGTRATVAAVHSAASALEAQAARAVPQLVLVQAEEAAGARVELPAGEPEELP